MRVLLTGGAGYLGSTLARRLLQSGASVRCLDLRADEMPGLVGGCEAVVGDVREEGVVRAALDGVDAVVHLAAVVGYPACDANPEAATSTNVDGATIVAGAAAAGLPLVLASTCSVYGRSDQGVCRESDAIHPLTLYGRTKARAEEIALDRGAVVFRFATIYGISPRFRWDLLVHTFCQEALAKGKLKLFEPDAWRPLLHVQDAAASIAFALRNFRRMAGRVFNVGSDDATVTKLDLARQLARFTDLEVEADRDRSDPDGRNYRVCFDRLSSFGFRPATPFSRGIRATFEAVRLLHDESINLWPTPSRFRRSA
jgi:nucleoside-diphosphate-sugar epimerase